MIPFSIGKQGIKSLDIQQILLTSNPIGIAISTLNKIQGTGHLRHFGASLTGDQYIALRYGPVAAGACRLMKACDADARTSKLVNAVDVVFWRKHFERNPDDSLTLHGDPGTDHLSPADMLMLESSYEKFRTSGRFEASCDTSHRYPEWKRAYRPELGKTSFRINMLDFFDDPEEENDPYFQVTQETLEAASYIFQERQHLGQSIGVTL